MAKVRRSPRLLVVGLIALLLAGLLTSPASADLKGGWWERTNGQYVILEYNYDDVYYSSPVQFRSNVEAAAAAWNNTPTNVAITPWVSGPAGFAPDIDFFESRGTPPEETWWAWTLNWPDPCDNCIYDRSMVMLNASTMNEIDDFLRTKVIVHEFGHVFGLAHTTHSPSVMLEHPEVELTYNLPQSYDISEINRLYP